MMASKTRVPVIGVPVQTKALSGSIRFIPSCRCPRAIRSPPWPSARRRGQCRADGGGILAVSDPALAARLDAWREALSASIPEEPKDD
jgi:5-(carboxyamino)imidazole ribonucleotide mutase